MQLGRLAPKSALDRQEIMFLRFDKILTVLEFNRYKKTSEINKILSENGFKQTIHCLRINLNVMEKAGYVRKIKTGDGFMWRLRE